MDLLILGLAIGCAGSTLVATVLFRVLGFTIAKKEDKKAADHHTDEGC